MHSPQSTQAPSLKERKHSLAAQTGGNRQSTRGQESTHARHVSQDSGSTTALPSEIDIAPASQDSAQSPHPVHLEGLTQGLPRRDGATDWIKATEHTEEATSGGRDDGSTTSHRPQDPQMMSLTSALGSRAPDGQTSTHL